MTKADETSADENSTNESSTDALSSPPIRVLIVDDDALVRMGLRVILDAEPDLTIVGEAGDGAEALALVRRVEADVVLMDVRMPKVDGITATTSIVAASGNGGHTPRVLVVTTFENDGYVHEALRAGASGFILKRARPEELANAVRLVAKGESLVLPEMTRRVIEAGARTARAGDPRVAAVKTLTEREAEILRALSRGASNAEIAEQLYLGVQTVKTHVASVLSKLGVRDRAQAIIVAYETGFVVPGQVSER